MDLENNEYAKSEEEAIEKLAKLDNSINAIGKNLTLINFSEKVGKRLQKYYTYLM